MESDFVIKSGDNFIITVSEGTGDNLLEEDIKQGYVDYIDSTIYKQEGSELVEIDGGEIMLSKLYKDMTRREIARTVLDFWRPWERSN